MLQNEAGWTAARKKERNMNMEDRVATFLHSLEKEEEAVVAAIEREALKEGVPIIRKETQSLLKVLLEMKKPERILEIGTAVGFSAILMSRFLGETCRIVTIEQYEKRIVAARANFRRAGTEERITLLEGDADKILPTLSETFDFIFVDAAKGQYLSYLPHVLRVLEQGGIILSDNVLQEGEILDSRFAVERRNRTIHSRMREYLYTIKRMEELETAILPVGDGVAISVKKEKCDE